MREKLLELMKNERLKSSQLAEMLEVNPAGISHLLAGRNKPGFDLLQKILRRFPQISPDWLMLDEGPMYREQQNTEHQQKASVSGSGDPKHAHAQSMDEELFARISQPTLRGNRFSSAATQAGTQTEVAASTGIGVPEQLSVKTRNVQVSHIVIFYEDQTFESYAPAARGQM